MTLEMTGALGLERLRRGISGAVIAAGEQGWDAARQAFNLAVDQRPEAVVYASTVEDVVAAVEFARDEGLAIAAQGTGHGAATLGELDDVLLLKTIRMAAVEIDPARRLARAEAGVVWGEVAGRAAEHGLAGLAGSSANVGVVGYTLGGGHGWLGRRHGFACNSVVALELVTATGQHLRVDRDHEPELFWALRGGGGSFGVVTAIEFELYPVGEVFAGTLFWPATEAAAVLERYRGWTQDHPDTLSSIFRLLNVPPIPAAPEHLRGRSVVMVEAAYLGPEEEAAGLLAPMRACDGLMMDTFATMPASGLGKVHGDPESPVPGIGDGLMLDRLTAEAAEALLAVGASGSGSPLTSLEMRHLGGALAVASPLHGALSSLDGEYVLFGVGSPTGPESAASIHAHLDAVVRAMAPWASDRDSLNFAARSSDPSTSFERAALERLRAVKRKYDPQGVFRSSHPITP